MEHQRAKSVDGWICGTSFLPGSGGSALSAHGIHLGGESKNQRSSQVRQPGGKIVLKPQIVRNNGSQQYGNGGAAKQPE
jgi:hypothetical protein